MTTKLLLLDESLLVQRVVELAYRDKGIDVQIAENADEALEMAENAAPDVVVASLDMEGSDGLGFCRRLREKPELSQVPLLVLTSTRNSVSDEEIQEVGAVANIEKPFKPVVFTDEVERIIGHGHSTSTPEPEAQAESGSLETGMEESPTSSGDATGESVETPSAEAEGAKSASDEEQVAPLRRPARPRQRNTRSHNRQTPGRSGRKDRPHVAQPHRRRRGKTAPLYRRENRHSRNR